MDRLTIPTLGMGTENDGIDDELESSGSISSGGLNDKYADFMENVEESWLEIIRVTLFESEGHVDPLHILCYGISADFVVSANLYVTIGMTFEYGVAKRYNFSVALFSRKVSTDAIDLEESHYQFDFYVMGTIGIRAGIELEVAVGLFSLKLDSVGICAEAGAYAQMWGYFYYSLSWSKSEGKSSYYAGALCIEIGLYLSISFKAQLFSSDKLTYNPTLYDEDWPLLGIGEAENIYDFAYEDDDDILNMEVETVTEFSLDTELFNMNYLDLKSGDLYGSESEDEDDDGEPDNEPGNYDDKEESHYTITLSNPKFTYDPEFNIVTLDPGISIEETCEITITWKHGTLAFSTQAIERTLTIHWTDPANRRFIAFNSMGGSSVKAISVATGAPVEIPAPPQKTGYDFAGWYEDWDCTKEFVFPSTMPNYLEMTNGERKGITVYAKWTPRTDVKYTVRHYLEEMGGRYKLADELDTTYLAENYDLSQPSIEVFYNGVSERPIIVTTSDDSALRDQYVVVTPRSYPGFTAQPVTTRQNTAPDGTSVVEIYYARNTCASTFTYGTCAEDGSDLAANNDSVVVKAKYGSTIYAPTLYLKGYIFQGFGLTDAQLADGIFVTGDKTYSAAWQLDNDTSYRIERYVERSV